MTPKAILFDCDGVVVDSEPMTDALLHRDLIDAGLTLSLDDIHTLFIGGTLRSVPQAVRELGGWLPDDWLDGFNTRLYAQLAAEVLPIPGIVDVLDRLDDAGIPYAMGSNGPVKKMKVTLGATGLWDRFAPHIYSGYDCPAPKPAPDVYLKAAEMLGISPEACVVIEDSPSGAKAGVAAGMRCFGFASVTPAERLAPICDQVFDSMDALPALLGLE